MQPAHERKLSGRLSAYRDDARGNNDDLDCRARRPGYGYRSGIGNDFHKLWRDAETGASDFQAIFVPWFWQDRLLGREGDRL